MFVLRFLAECVMALAFPFILMSFALWPSSYRESWHYRYRADTFFRDVPGYAEMIRDTYRDVELTRKERWEVCKILERDLVCAIKYASALESQNT